MNYLLVLTFIFVAAFLIVAALSIVYLIAPHHPGRVKNSPYECGEQPIGIAWMRFHVGYYLFGLLFLVFDVEAAFLFPWALAFRDVGLFALIEGGIFIAVLLIALIYAWRKGVLEWA